MYDRLYVVSVLPSDDLVAKHDKFIGNIYFFGNVLFKVSSNAHHDNNTVNMYFQTHEESRLKDRPNVSLKCLVKKCYC